MVVLYASERNWLALSRPEFPLASPVVGTIAWPAFLALAPEAECCVVAVPSAPDVGVCDALHAFRGAFPCAPLVLVADRTLPVSLLSLGEVVRPPLRLRSLWPAIQRACTRSLLSETASWAGRARTPRSPAHAALAVVCRADPPVRSVTALAAAVGCHRRTLWRHWRDVGEADEYSTVERLLAWGLVLRACTLHRAGRPWHIVAARLGVHRHTLARAATQVTGARLTELTPDALPGLRERFRRVIAGPLAAALLQKTASAEREAYLHGGAPERSGVTFDSQRAPLGLTA